MVDGGNTVPRITKSEHIGPDDTGDNIQAKRVASYIWDPALGVAGEWKRAESNPITGYATSAKQDSIITDLDYRYSGGKTAYSTTLAASGDTTLITPASGKRIQVYWISFVPNSDNSAANLISLGFGTTGGSISTELYRGYAMAHWELFTGTANQSVIVNAGTAQPVAITIHWKEIP